MDMDQKIVFIQKSLLDWFCINGRDFPWRKQGIQNYQILLSEILLQRTKAETVAKYYSTFFDKYPDWQTLGEATLYELEEIIKPLGLYTQRAKRIYSIAQGIKKRLGNMPTNRQEVEDSGFVGLYIANAYELFVLKNRKPLLDVNMSRLLKRLFNQGEFKDVRLDKEIQIIADLLVNNKKCKELNWAILDFASMICKSKNPLCEQCILKSNCMYYESIQEHSTILAEEYQFKLDLAQDNKSYEHKTINVLSLFSGCGGMDLGLEGGFTVNKKSINEITNPDYIDEYLNNDLVRLKSSRFKIVFANDILKVAETA